MPETLIVRLPNWLGDTVMAVPALRALRAGRPGVRIVLAGPWAALLAGQELADLLVDYPRPWRRRAGSARAVRALRPDVALLLPNSFEAAAAARYWGARRRIGFAGNGRDWLLTDPLPLPSPRRHQIDEYLALLEPLRVEPAGREPWLAPPAAEDAARRRARALLAEAGAPGRPRVGLHLGAAFGPSKLWPADRVVEFCRRAAREGWTPVLLGAPDDVPRAETVTAAAPAASIAGRDGPDLLPAVLAELDAVVCGDTGVGHLAAALGTPVVALFGPTDWRRTAPRGPVEVARRPVACSPCFYRRCPIDHPCMRGITSDDVHARVGALLARPAPASGGPTAGGPDLVSHTLRRPAPSGESRESPTSF